MTSSRTRATPGTQAQMHLNAFLMASGHHNAAWRLPSADPRGATSLEHTIAQAQVAEAAKFDSLFFADVLWTGYSIGDTPTCPLDALILGATVVPATQRIGIIVTVSTSFNDPFNLARRIASLDHMSNGRAAWNCITSSQNVEARNFGSNTIPDHDRRYERASEFIGVVVKLWDSWESDAYVADQASGIWADTDKVHEIDHDGDFFNVVGPLTAPRSPQGRPVIVQAGSSGPGIELAARSAEAVFTAQQTLEQGQAFYRALKDQVAAAGRSPNEVKVLPGLAPIVASTEAEAQALQNELAELATPRWMVGFLSRVLEYPFTEADLDGPLPEHLPAETRGHVHRAQLLLDQARRERLTARQLAQRAGFARGHLTVVGTPEQVADQMELWFVQGAADGFNVMPPALPSGLHTFAEEVVPILQRRGLFRSEYEGATLREHFGLPMPGSRMDDSVGAGVR